MSLRPDGTKNVLFQTAHKKTGGPYFRHCSTIIGIESLTSMFGMGIGVTFQINHRKRPQPAYSPGQGIFKFGRAAFFA